MNSAPRGVSSLVEAQVKRWAADRGKASARSAGRPVITLSRQYGARGAAVGQRVADALGFELWDKALVHEIANSAETTARAIETLDERRRNTFADVMSNFMRGKGLTSSDYLARLASVVHTIAGHGGAVIVGRGAQHLLGDQRALRVRIVAPLEQRVAGVMERRGLDKKAARLDIKAVEADRARFVKQTYGADIDDPVHYDMVLNLGALSVEEAARMIVASYRARFDS